MSYQSNLLENTFPKNIGETTDQKITKIHNYLFQLNEQLRYIFSNLDSENFNSTELEGMKAQLMSDFMEIYAEMPVASLSSGAVKIRGKGEVQVALENSGIYYFKPDGIYFGSKKIISV